MNIALYYALAWPWIVICSIAEFIVWGKYSGKRQTVPQTPSDPGGVGREIELVRQIRELDYESRRKIEELQKKLHDEQKNKKR